MKTINHYLTLLSVILFGVNFGTFGQTITFNYSGNITTYTVPAGVCSITITAKGAQGGSTTTGAGAAGGQGANISATFQVTAGQVLRVLVGQHPANATYRGGGGGGSFVWDPTSTAEPLVAAGGGGGAGDGTVGINAVTTNDGTNGGGGVTYGGNGTSGTGGSLIFNATPCNNTWGGGGTGWLSAGGSGSPTTCTTTAGGGSTPLTGGAGGTRGGSTAADESLGGFGGGGGGQGSCAGANGGAGGGGGYGGGGGGMETCPAGTGSLAGGGGGSYIGVAGVTPTTSVGNTGNGVVIISVASLIPVAGTILGHDTICQNTTSTYTDPSAVGAGDWSSSNTGVATVGSLTGIVTGASAGTAIISYYINSLCGEVVATFPITVLPAPAPIVSPHTSICVGGVELNDTVSDIDHGGTWSSSNLFIAAVGSLTGLVTGSAPGTATISYSLNGCYATTVVTVNPLPAPITGAAALCVGDSEALSDGTGGGIWTSQNTATAVIGSISGIVQSVSVHGSHTLIYYTLPTGCYNGTSFSLTINPPPAPITQWESSLGYAATIVDGYTYLCQASTDTLSISIPSGGTWSSSVPAVASVTQMFGGALSTTYGFGYDASLVGISAGTTIISYSVAGCPPATDTVVINPLPAPIDGIASICTGMPVSLADSSAGGSWTSSDPSIAVIDPVTGVITTSSSDTVGESTIITYTLPTGCLIVQQVTVATAPHSIVGPDSVCQGASVTFTEDTTGGIWTSSTLAIAQVIDSSGVVNGVMTGAATISYTLPSGCYAAHPIFVKPPIPAFVWIGLSPTDTICAGTPMEFWATDSNAGTPTFQWQRFDTGLVGQTNDTLHYVPTHGDVIIIQMVTHGICSVSDTVYDTVGINVFPASVVPTINITCPDTTSFPGHYTLQFPGQVYTFFSDVVWGALTPHYQWFEGDSLIVGATGSSFAASVYGNDTVYCVVYGYPPCDTTIHTDTSNKYYIYGAYLGVKSVSSANNGLSLFPNPNNGGFAVSGTIATGTNNNLEMEITDVLGNVVYSGTTNATNGVVNQQIKLSSSLPPGSYVLKVNSANDNEVFHFVISK